MKYNECVLYENMFLKKESAVSGTWSHVPPNIWKMAIPLQIFVMAMVIKCLQMLKES